MVRVLALDLSTRCGWAADDPARSGVPILGSWRLPSLKPDTVDLSNARLLDLIESALRVHSPDVLIYESAMPSGGKKGFTVSAMGEALRAQPYIAGLAAARNGIERREVMPATVRKHFCGHGFPKDRKLAVIRACRMLGWDPADDNEADAAAIWSYAKSLYNPEWAPSVTPLFREKI